MVINIPTSSDRIYEQYFTFMNPFFNLTPNEIKLVAAMLTLYKETEGAKETIRWGYVFSKEGKDFIERQSGMNKNQITLTLSGLNKKTYQGQPILLKEPYKALHPVICIDPTESPTITINFVFNQEKKQDDIEQAPERDNNEYREEVQDIAPREPEVMEPAVSYDEGENTEVSTNESPRKLPPGFLSSYYAE